MKIYSGSVITADDGLEKSTKQESDRQMSWDLFQLHQKFINHVEIHLTFTLLELQTLMEFTLPHQSRKRLHYDTQLTTPSYLQCVW